MRQNLLISLTLGVLFAACADHAGGVFPAGDAPRSPTNDGGGTDPLDQGGDPGNGSNVIVDGGQSIEVPAHPETPLGPLDTTDGGAGGGGGGGDGGGGDGGGQPVPEPGTLLLVGTGLAGVALLRRRRRNPEPQAE